jgi:hypothetical protein
MSPLKKTSIAVLAALLLTSGWHYRQGQGRAQEATQLRAENTRLRLQASQRHEARVAGAAAAGAATGSQMIAEIVGQPSGADPAVTPPPGPVKPDGRVSNYRNEGRSTPQATLQTLAWACDQGDAGLMEKLLVFDDIALKKTEAYFVSLPPEARPPVTSYEAVAAAVYISDGMQHPYPVAEVLQHARFEPVNASRFVLRLPGGNGDGYEFQQTAEGWKVAITEAVVDEYIRQNQPPAQAGR